MLSRRDVAKNRLEGRKIGRSVYLSNQIRHQELQLIYANRKIYQDKVAAIANNKTSYNPTGIGRGIVICAGGPRYFTCAYVLINQLRALGCKLPIEVWYLGKREFDRPMLDIMTNMGIDCRDAYACRSHHPARILNGWELNPYSIIYSKFDEVLFLDADNIPVKDPTYLFDSEEYKRTGAVFWPDYRNLAKTREIWSVMNVPFKDEPEFESGQMLINKDRCWNEINLAMHLNEHSDFYYRFVHGDKETYHMAWRYLNTEYSMPSKRIHKLPEVGNSVVMCQHDFQNSRLFQHRNMDKWKLDGSNKPVQGFLFDSECRGYLADLRSLWNGHMSRPYLDDKESEAVKATGTIATYQLHNITLNYTKVIKLNSNMTINAELGECSEWFIQNENSGIGGEYELNLTMNQDHRIKYKFIQRAPNEWQGYDAFNFDRVVFSPYNQTL